jgi:Reverse transcriptase (RNA-dependent DNA polymerase)
VNKTFVLVAKLDTVRTLISIAVNDEWKLHQLDVKNIFLHGKLMKEVCMEIPSDFSTDKQWVRYAGSRSRSMS